MSTADTLLLSKLSLALSRIEDDDSMTIRRTATGHVVTFHTESDEDVAQALLVMGATVTAGRWRCESDDGHEWFMTGLDLDGARISIMTPHRKIATLEDRLAETADRVALGETTREIAAKPLRLVAP